MTPLIVSLLLAAGGGEAIRVAAPGLSVVNLDPSAGSFYNSSLAQLLNYQGVRVSTSEELASLLGLERQQQLAGCSDDRCRSVIAATVGIDGLLVGQVAKLEGSYQLDVKVLETGTGRPLAAATTSAPSQERFLATFELVAIQLSQQLSTALGRPLVRTDGNGVVRKWSTVKRLSFVPLAVGVASVVTGGVLLGMAKGEYDLISIPRNQQSCPGGACAALTPDQVSRSVQSGGTYQTLGWVAVGAGAALLATAATMFFLGGDETFAAGVAFLPNLTGFTLRGSF